MDAHLDIVQRIGNNIHGLSSVAHRGCSTEYYRLHKPPCIYARSYQCNAGIHLVQTLMEPLSHQHGYSSYTGVLLVIEPTVALYDDVFTNVQVCEASATLTRIPIKQQQPIPCYAYVRGLTLRTISSHCPNGSYCCGVYTQMRESYSVYYMVDAVSIGHYILCIHTLPYRELVLYVYMMQWDTHQLYRLSRHMYQ